jgi:hypothetical protein
MKLKSAAFAAALATLVPSLLAGCAGRSAQPVAAVQPQDPSMDCDAIRAETDANNRKLTDLSGEKGATVAQNVAVGVAGLLVWPLWFAMDFQGAAATEETALQSRQAYLATLAAKRCSVAQH